MFDLIRPKDPAGWPETDDWEGWCDANEIFYRGVECFLERWEAGEPHVCRWVAFASEVGKGLPAPSREAAKVILEHLRRLPNAPLPIVVELQALVSPPRGDTLDDYFDFRWDGLRRADGRFSLACMATVSGIGEMALHVDDLHDGSTAWMDFRFGVQEYDESKGELCSNSLVMTFDVEGSGEISIREHGASLTEALRKLIAHPMARAILTEMGCEVAPVGR